VKFKNLKKFAKVHKSSWNNKVRKSSHRPVNPGLHRKKTSRCWHRYALCPIVSMLSNHIRVRTMNSNVDQFLSHDPAEVTCDNTLTAILLCYAIARFELYELYFISVKVVKVQVKNKVHKVRTSQLWFLHLWQKHHRCRQFMENIILWVEEEKVYHTSSEHTDTIVAQRERKQVVVGCLWTARSKPERRVGLRHRMTGRRSLRMPDALYKTSHDETGDTPIYTCGTLFIHSFVHSFILPRVYTEATVNRQ